MGNQPSNNKGGGNPFAPRTGALGLSRAELDQRCVFDFDALQAMFAERMDRQEERMARQTRWAIGMLGLVCTAVTFLLAIQTLGLAP